MSDFSNRFHHHVPGVNNAASYMSSGHAFMTGGLIASEHDAWQEAAETFGHHGYSMHIKFPQVTKSITIRNKPDRLFTALPPAAPGEGLGGFVDAVPTATGTIAVHFTPSASALPGNHFVVLLPEQSVTLNVRCKEIFITNIEQGSGATTAAPVNMLRSASFQLIAELTSIPGKEMYILSGSGITEGEGVHS